MTDGRATEWFTLWTTIAMVIIAVLSPLLGTIADFNGQKKRMLGAFLGLGVASVAAMFFIYKGDFVLASILFILANIGANGSFVFYDALLPHIARDDEVDRVSTAGYAAGLRRRRHSARTQPGVDSQARMVRSSHGKGPLASGHTTQSSRILVGCGLVANLFHSTISPRTGAAGRRRGPREWSAGPGCGSTG